MKKLILIALLLWGSNVSLLADYVAGYQSCEHRNGMDNVYFIVKGKGNKLSAMGSNLAMGAFLDAEYATETYKYCKNKAIIHADGVVWHFKTKAKANRKFSSLINDYKHQKYVKELIIVSRGYNESAWDK